VRPICTGIAGRRTLLRDESRAPMPGQYLKKNLRWDDCELEN